MIADTGQVFNPASADKYYRVFLKVMAFARNVGRDLNVIGQPDTGDLAQSRVRLFGGHSFDLHTYAAFLG
jgi:hypothetical protein